ncbi:MAG: acylphosphatase [Chloroflexi bacterium]|nr:acylphosphatase [Chloroflexota bacterium]
MPDLASLKAVVRGRVQGVYFRAFVSGQARSLGLTGYVRNLPDVDEVEVFAEGSRDRLQELLSHLRTGPPGARVDHVEGQWLPFAGSSKSFEVRY